MLPAPCLGAGCRIDPPFPSAFPRSSPLLQIQLHGARRRWCKAQPPKCCLSSASHAGEEEAEASKVRAGSLFGGEKQLAGPKKFLEDMPATTRYVTCTAIVAGALMAGYAVGSRAKGIPNAALAGALALGTVGGVTAYAVNSMAPEVAAVKLHNTLVHHPDPKSLTVDDIEAVLRKFGIDKRSEKFVEELKYLYDCYVTSVIPPGNEELKGDEADAIASFKNALGLDDPEAASVHMEIGRRILRQRLETGDEESAVGERRAFQKLVYVSTLLFGEASKFLLPWKRVFKYTDAQVEVAIRDNAQRLFNSRLNLIGTDMNLDQLKDLRKAQLQIKLSDELASGLVKLRLQKLLEGYISRALEVMKARTRVKDTKKALAELEGMLAFNSLISSLAEDPEASSLPGLGPVSVVGGEYDGDRQMDDLKLLYRTYLTEAVFRDGRIVKEKLPALADLKNLFALGNREAEDIKTEITTRIYRKRLAQAVNSRDIDAATSKAKYLQDLCNSLQFEPAKASAVHEEIYRQKLEQCVSDGSLSEEDVSALLRLRVLLCIPQEVVEAAHADICGRIFAKIVDTAIASGIDSYDADMRDAVRGAVKGLRLSEKAAMEIAAKAVRAVFMTYVRRSRTADSRTEAAKELRKMIVFNNLVVTELVDDIKQAPRSATESKEEEKQEPEEKKPEDVDEEIEMLQSLRKTKVKKSDSARGKDPQREINLKDELSLRDRTDLYRIYLVYCLTGETTHMPFGSQIVVQRDESEFERLSELGVLLGLTPMEVGGVHKSLAEQAFKQKAEVILADGKLLPQKMEQLAKVQKQLGLPNDSFQRVVQNIATTRMANAIDTAVRKGELRVEEIKEMKESGVKIDTVISVAQREKMYSTLVEKQLSSGKGEFDDEYFSRTVPAELEIDAEKCKKMVEDQAKQRLSSSLVQAVALLRQKNSAGVVFELNNLLLADQLLGSASSVSWPVREELNDLFCVYIKSDPSPDKKERLKALFGFDDEAAQSMEEFVASNGFSLAAEEEELKF